MSATRASRRRPARPRPRAAEPVAWVALVDLLNVLGEQLHRRAAEYFIGHEHDAYLWTEFLAIGLDNIRVERHLDAELVAGVRDALHRARRLELAAAFTDLNPEFGAPIPDGCWTDLEVPAVIAREGVLQRNAHRRELALALGDRIGELLCLAGEGVAG